MLLDFVYNRLEIKKYRLHFNEFMVNFHDFRHEKKENNSIDLDPKLHFGWHGKKFKNSDYLLNLKNEKNKN